jgi:hypothetical protein
MTISCRILLGMRNISYKVVKKIKTHTLRSITFLSCRFWNNVENCDTVRQASDDNIIRYMCVACWITKATNTLSILIAFSVAQTVTLMRLNIRLYVHCFILFSTLYAPPGLTLKTCAFSSQSESMVSYNSQITMIISLKSFNRLHFVTEVQ